MHHAPLIDVERRADVFSSSGCYRSRIAPQEEDMIAKDDPAHHDQRALVARRFTPKAVQRLEPVIDAVVDDLVDAFVGRGEMEVVDDLAAPFPARLTAHLLGFGEEHAPAVRSWSERLMRIDGIADDQVADDGHDDARSGVRGRARAARRGPARRAAATISFSIWANARARRLPDRAVGHGAGDRACSSRAAPRRRARSSHAGSSSSTRHPDQWEAMAADPSLIPGAVEELIRWVTPLNNFFRTATRDATIAGTEVRAGDRVILLYPSANRDESVFDEPYTFDIRRDPNPHVAFGFGTHFCLGASLARLELRMLFAQLTRRITNLRVRHARPTSSRTSSSARCARAASRSTRR